MDGENYNDNECNRLKYHKILYVEEIEKLNQKIKYYTDKINSLEKEVIDNKQIVSRISYIEDNNKMLCENLEKLEKENKILKEEKSQLIKNFQYEREAINKKTEQALNSQKAYIDSINSKLAAFESIDRLNKVQCNDISILEKIINHYEKDWKMKFQNSKLKNEIKFSEFKRNMMDHIEHTQQNVEKLNVFHMDVTSKVTMLQNNQLLMRIESLTKVLEDLLTKNTKQERIIQDFKKEVEVHKEVESTLAFKNKMYLNALNDLTEKMYKITSSNNEILYLNNIKENNNSNNNKEIFGSQDCVKKNVSENNSFLLNEINFKTTNSKFFNRSNSYFFNKEINNKTAEKNQISKLEKIIIKKKKEIEDLKTKYEVIQEKFNFYEKKISNFYKLIEDVMNYLSEDPSIIENHEIILNIDKLKNSEFDMLSIQQKYSILSIFMKKLMPFILFDKLEDNENLKNIKFKCQPISLNSSLSTTILDNQFKTIFSKRNSKKIPHKVFLNKDSIKINKKSELNTLLIPQNASIF